MRNFLLAAASAVALTTASPAWALLSIAFQDQGTGSTDTQNTSGSSLLFGATTIGNFSVEGSFAASVATGNLSDANLTITNTGTTTDTLFFTVGEIGYAPGATDFAMSGSGTFNDNVCATCGGSLSFHVDPANEQGGTLDLILGPTAPGTLLFEPSLIPVTTNPQAFDGNETVPFPVGAPYSMALDYSVTLQPGGSIVGLESAIDATAVPEASTWVMLVAGFGLLAFAAQRKRASIGIA
jgi:hypothetical protein